jgi:hypothetical protein
VVALQLGELEIIFVAVMLDAAVGDTGNGWPGLVFDVVTLTRDRTRLPQFWQKRSPSSGTSLQCWQFCMPLSFLLSQAGTGCGTRPG